MQQVSCKRSKLGNARVSLVAVYFLESLPSIMFCSKHLPNRWQENNWREPRRDLGGCISCAGCVGSTSLHVQAGLGLFHRKLDGLSAQRLSPACVACGGLSKAKAWVYFVAFCLDVRTSTCCQLMVFQFNHKKLNF